MIEYDEFYPLYGATLELIQWDEQGDPIMHFRDERGSRHTLNVKGKESRAMELFIYFLALLIVVVGVVLAIWAF